MKQEQLHEFEVDKGTQLQLIMPEGVFVPTGTSTVLFEAVRSYVSKPGKLLDLGCGSGALGIALDKIDLIKHPLYASDLSEQAVTCIQKNANLHSCPVIAKSGALFTPWGNETFDYIVDDVSGIAEGIAEISPWFDQVPCYSGIDGTDLVIQVLREAAVYLRPEGLLFFPIISFSNEDKILDAARENFDHVQQLAHEEWPLPKEMYEHTSKLKKLQSEGHIKFQEKFGMIIFATDVYVAYN